MIPAHEAAMVHGIQPSGSTSNYPPLIRRQSRNHWLNNRLLVQSVRSDQHERACPAITSISHAEGHWFDPSRDHHQSVQVRGLILALDQTQSDRSAELYQNRTKLLDVADVPVVMRIQPRRHIVEFVVVEIGIDVGGHGDRRVAHRLLQQPQIDAGPTREGWPTGRWRGFCRLRPGTVR